MRQKAGLQQAKSAHKVAPLSSASPPPVPTLHGAPELPWGSKQLPSSHTLPGNLQCNRNSNFSQRTLTWREGRLQFIPWAGTLTTNPSLASTTLGSTPLSLFGGETGGLGRVDSGNDFTLGITNTLVVTSPQG